jgi:dTDP-4-amino-4,6-dideoxygalactose transaminase
MEPNHLEDTIKSLLQQSTSLTGSPRVIIPVHLYGHPADMRAILEIAQKYDLSVLEDCAQAHGTEINGSKVGSFGQIAAFSFYPTKNLGALGDGGMVVTNSKELNQELINLRQYGWQKRYISSSLGINTRLDELQAAILNEKLKFLDANNRRRIQIAASYQRTLDGTKFRLPELPDSDFKHVYHQYVIQTRQRDKLKTFLQENNVGSAIHYPVPIHNHPAFNKWILSGPGGLPHTEKVCGDILSLPMFPELQNKQIDLVCNLMMSWTNEIER